MASTAVRSLLRQTAQEYDLLFPDGGLSVPDFLLKDRYGDLQPGWRERFGSIVSNEWAVTEKIFSERPYSTVVEIRDQLRLRAVRLLSKKSAAEGYQRCLLVVCAALQTLKSKHKAETQLRDVLGEASPRSMAGKMGWSFDSGKEFYSLRLTCETVEGRDSVDVIPIEFGSDASLELVQERLREKQDGLEKERRKTDRSRQICVFKLQVLDAMLWQYEMFGELAGLSAADIEQAASQQEEREMLEKSEACNVPALREAWEWMLSNRRRCWDASGRPNARAIWQAILLDAEHSQSLMQVSGPEKGRNRISSETADRYMDRFEKEAGAEGLAEFQRSLGVMPTD